MLAQRLLMGIGSGSARTLNYVAQSTSAFSTIGVPVTATEGDVAVLYDFVRNTLGTPTPVTPTGWTLISDLAQNTGASVLSYRILTAADVGATVTGMSGTALTTKSMVVFRATPTLTGITVQNMSEEYNGANPAAQLVPALSTYPYLVYGVAGGLSALPTWSSVWYSNTGAVGFSTYAWQRYNTGGASLSVDCNDSGTGTFLHSCAIIAT